MTKFRTMLAAAKTIIDDEGYTSAQIADMTKAQLATHLELPVDAAYWSGGNYGLFTAIRTHLVDYVLAKENKAIAQAIKGTLAVADLQWIVQNIDRVVEFLED